MTVIGSLNVMDMAKNHTSIGTLTVKVVGLKRFKLQNALGILLIKAGVAVLPVNVDLEIEEDGAFDDRDLPTAEDVKGILQ